MELFIYFLLFNSIVFGVGFEKLIVDTNSGKLLGKTGIDKEGNNFFSFQSIPYAKPPVERLRFRAPEPVEKWLGVLNATQPSPFCPQENFAKPKTLLGQEDCLYLNIYTPHIHRLKPVMVFIHGGAFFKYGAAIFGPEYLMPKNVVLVTINYRLGLLGFLKMKNESLKIPGNAGMKDQVLALKWIKENINYFGGDPDSITIFGESAGAASVHLHMLSPMSKGLFHKAIIQSGCALNSWVVGHDDNGLHLVEKLQISNHKDDELFEKLINVPLHDIFQAQLEIVHAFDGNKPTNSGVVIETQRNEPAFLSDDPVNIIKSGNYNSVPLMLGFNNYEGINFQVRSKLRSGNFVAIDDYTNYLPYNLKQKSEVGDMVKNFYESLSYDKDKEYLLPTINFITDTWFFYFIYVTTVQHSKSCEPVYFYKFCLDSKINLNKNLVTGLSIYTGASHADELGYLFPTAFTPKVEPGSFEAVSVDKVVTLWTNFARFGNPTPLTHLWKPFKEDEINVLTIGRELETNGYFESDRIGFWSEIYKKYSIV